MDVGAHHARRFSNSYWAYLRGWSGVAIDPSESAAKSFWKSRPRDIFVRKSVTLHQGSAVFHVFDEGALNTTNSARSEFLSRQIGTRSRELIVPAAPLAQILDSAWNAPPTPVIDFMTIDVEGSEMDVLLSNDWERYKPRVIVVELLGQTLSSVLSAPEVVYLSKLGYQAVAMLYHSVVLVCDPALLNAHWGVTVSER